MCVLAIECVLYRMCQGMYRHDYGQPVTRLSLFSLSLFSLSLFSLSLFSLSSLSSLSLPLALSLSLPLPPSLSQKYRQAVQKGRSKAQQLSAGASGAIWSMGRKCGAFTRMSLRPLAQSAPPQTEGTRSPLPRKPEQNLRETKNAKCPWRRSTPVRLCGGESGLPLFWWMKYFQGKKKIQMGCFCFVR
jgi:hypothetical protein